MREEITQHNNEFTRARVRSYFFHPNTTNKIIQKKKIQCTNYYSINVYFNEC